VIVRWGAAAVVLACMARWSALNLQGAVGWRDLVDHPERRDGHDVVLSLVTVERAIGPDRFVVRHGSLPLEVVGDPREVAPGEDVTIGGTFSASEGAVVARWIEHRPARTAKKALGLAGIAVLGVVLATSFRRGPAGIEIRG
jgi:hypothetical protein